MRSGSLRMDASSKTLNGFVISGGFCAAWGGLGAACAGLGAALNVGLVICALGCDGRGDARFVDNNGCVNATTDVIFNPAFTVRAAVAVAVGGATISGIRIFDESKIDRRFTKV